MRRISCMWIKGGGIWSLWVFFFGGGVDVWGSASAGVGQRRGVLVALVMVLVVFESCCYASHCHS